MFKSINKENEKREKLIVLRIKYEKKGIDSAVKLSKDVDHEEEKKT